jgi:hypothetical protein
VNGRTIRAGAVDGGADVKAVCHSVPVCFVRLKHFTEWGDDWIMDGPSGFASWRVVQTYNVSWPNCLQVVKTLYQLHGLFSLLCVGDNCCGLMIR